MDESDNGPPPWNKALAATTIGKTVLIGLTYIKPSGELDRQVQLHGVITHADPHDGFRVELKGTHAGETYDLPPHLPNLQRAPRGSFRLRSTREVVKNPHFISNWTVEASPETANER